MLDLGSVGSTWERGIAIAEALSNNYPDIVFAVGRNKTNNDVNIYIEGDKHYRKTSETSYMISDSDCLKVENYRGFMRGIIVERGWLTP